jgi:hypothetical protein
MLSEMSAQMVGTSIGQNGNRLCDSLGDVATLDTARLTAEIMYSRNSQKLCAAMQKTL